jgi:transposase-like protein
MAVSEKKTGRQQYGPEQKLLAIAGTLDHNRRLGSAASQASRPRDRLGHFSGAGAGQPSLNSIVQHISADYKVTESTIWNWRRQYISGGYAALARRRRADKGISKILRRTPELRRMIDARLSAGMSPLAVWRSLLWVRGLHAPSYDFVLNYARCGSRPDGESPAHAGSAEAR